MATVYLGLGSNINAQANLSIGVRELRATFGDVELSPVYQSPPFGFEGEDFLNLAARIESDWPPSTIHAELERIHGLAGRSRGSNAFLARTLDIDLLLYDDHVVDQPPIRLPRRDVLEYSFVLKPLADIAPDILHPVSGRTLADEWARFDQSCHPLQLVDVIL